MPSPLTYTHDGHEYEGFRPYEGEADKVNIRTLHGPSRYALVIAIVSLSPREHQVWSVIDTKPYIDSFIRFITLIHPNKAYIRFLRSRT